LNTGGGGPGDSWGKKVAACSRGVLNPYLRGGPPWVCRFFKGWATSVGPCIKAAVKKIGFCWGACERSNKFSKLLPGPFSFSQKNGSRKS